MHQRQHYTVAEVATLFLCKPCTIRRWLRLKKLTATVTPGGTRLISADQVEAYLGKIAPGQHESSAAVDKRLGKLADQLQQTKPQRAKSR